MITREIAMPKLACKESVRMVAKGRIIAIEAEILWEHLDGCS